MKLLLSVLTLSFISLSPTYAKTKIIDCSLYVNNPVITHTMYGKNTNSNAVNSGVLRILQENGFTISTNEAKAKYTMNTEVRCGKVLTMFGFQDSCQTEITIIDNLNEKLSYSYGPTMPKVGLNIDFNSITFPVCSNL